MQEKVAEQHFKRAIAFHVRGRLAEAEESYRSALKINPDLADGWNNLGCVQKDLGRYSEAEASLRAALRLNSQHVNALINLAFVCDVQGDPVQALDIVTNVLSFNDSKVAKDIFVNCVKRIRIASNHDALRSVMVRALMTPWTRPVDLSRVAADLVKLNPSIRAFIESKILGYSGQTDSWCLIGHAELSAIASDLVLQALLDSAPICDIELEKLLTIVRHAMLDAALSDAKHGEPTELLKLYGGVARQCFINEYVYTFSGMEMQRAQALVTRLSEAISVNSPIPAMWVLAISAYSPLYSIPHTYRLLEREWPDAVQAVLTMQLREHAEETRYREKIQAITPIKDKVSICVRKQYEENPYPRWINLAPPEPVMTIDQLIFRRFPYAKYQSIGKDDKVDILVAGCGTGQHPIGRAQTIRGGRVLAIDLSLASLSYAMRKAEELNIKNIEFAQGDILKLGVVNQVFDVIEAVGVLHHMNKPLDGWRVLSSLLRPGGIMRLGIYSELGRADVVAARELIRVSNYDGDADSIRRCRQVLMKSSKDSALFPVIQRRDFFSMSTCRDLLFHMSEHRFGLPEINDFINRAGLRFLGFEIPFDILHEYRRSYPDDIGASSLDQWHDFEIKYPDTFRGMYQFWVQKSS